VSGSDDHMVRVWDVRDRSGTLRAPQGVLVGEWEGVEGRGQRGDFDWVARGPREGSVCGVDAVVGVWVCGGGHGWGCEV